MLSNRSCRRWKPFSVSMERCRFGLIGRLKGAGIDGLEDGEIESRGGGKADLGQALRPLLPCIACGRAQVALQFMITRLFCYSESPNKNEDKHNSS